LKFPAALLLLLALIGCSQGPVKPVKMPHLMHYFEIPVADMNRAASFYEHLFAIKLNRQTVDGYEMALFPHEDGAPGASGALAKGDAYVPSHNGPVLYFSVRDIKAIVAQAETLGSKVLYPVKDIGEGGWVAEVEDSEGNRLALNQPKG
jgi:uncharacterized protein